MFDASNQVWLSVVGDVTGSYLGTDYTVTEGIVAGTFYQFRMRASNRWGWGVFTDEPHTEILASTVPGKVTTPVTSIDDQTGGVKVTWE